MSGQPRLRIRPADLAEAPWVAAQLQDAWGDDETMLSRGLAHDATRLPALLAVDGSEILGLAVYRVADHETELVALDAVVPGRGAVSALLAAVVELARAAGCRRLWLITTNDNLDALRFYQRRGLRLAAVHRGAVDAARRVKPEIPEIGADGIMAVLGPQRDSRGYSALVDRASAAAATARSTALTSRTAPVSAEVAIAA